MTPRLLIRHEHALNDLEELASFIARDSLPAALRLLDAAERAFSQIREMPGIGASIRYASPRLDGVRRWPIPGYPNHLVFYRCTEDRIEILRVLHAARDIPATLLDEAIGDEEDL